MCVFMYVCVHACLHAHVFQLKPQVYPVRALYASQPPKRAAVPGAHPCSDTTVGQTVSALGAGYRRGPDMGSSASEQMAGP